MEIKQTNRVRICVPMHLLSNPKTMHNSQMWMIGWPTDWLLTFWSITRHSMLFRFFFILMKLEPNQSKPIRKRHSHTKVWRYDTWKKKWKSTFRACEINSLFQFGSMDILIFYASRATYVRCVKIKQQQPQQHHQQPHKRRQQRKKEE